VELTLNLLWAFLSALTLVVWTRDVRSRQLQRSVVARSGAALFCLLILLFPVISITDDLHATEFVEDSTSGRKARAAASGEVTAGTTAAVATVSVQLAIPAATVESLVSVGPTPALAGTVLVAAGRAPPRLSTSL